MLALNGQTGRNAAHHRTAAVSRTNGRFEPGPFPGIQILALIATGEVDQLGIPDHPFHVVGVRLADGVDQQGFDRVGLQRTADKIVEIVVVAVAAGCPQHHDVAAVEHRVGPVNECFIDIEIAPHQQHGRSTDRLHSGIFGVAADPVL